MLLINNKKIYKLNLKKLVHQKGRDLKVLLLLLLSYCVIISMIVLSSIDKGRFLDMLKEHKTVTTKQCKRSQVNVRNVCDDVIMM